MENKFSLGGPAELECVFGALPVQKYTWGTLAFCRRGSPDQIPIHPASPLAGIGTVVVYYCRTYMKAVRGGGVKRGDVCYGMLRAAACVDESDHHALMYVWHGQIVREDRVGEASA